MLRFPSQVNLVLTKDAHLTAISSGGSSQASPSITARYTTGRSELFRICPSERQRVAFGFWWQSAVGSCKRRHCGEVDIGLRLLPEGGWRCHGHREGQGERLLGVLRWEEVGGRALADSTRTQGLASGVALWSPRVDGQPVPEPGAGRVETRLPGSIPTTGTLSPPFSGGSGLCLVPVSSSSSCLPSFCWPSEEAPLGDHRESCRCFSACRGHGWPAWGTAALAAMRASLGVLGNPMKGVSPAF